MSWKEIGKWLGWLMNQEDYTEEATIKQAEEMRHYEGREIFNGEVKTLSPRVKKVCEQFTSNLGGWLDAHDTLFVIWVKERNAKEQRRSIVEVHLNACLGFWTSIGISVGTRFYTDSFLTNLREGKLNTLVWDHYFLQNVQRCKGWSPYNPSPGFYELWDGAPVPTNFVFYLIPAEDFTEYRLMSLLEIFAEEALKKAARQHFYKQDSK